MLDIILFRVDKGGDPEAIRASQRARGADPALVDQVIEKDSAWRAAEYKKTQMNQDINKVQALITAKRVAKEDSTELQAQKVALEREQAELKTHAEALSKERDRLMLQIGNIVHPSVVISTDEANNRVEKTWGTELHRAPDGLFHHHELLHMIDGFEDERGKNVAGHRGYYLKGPGLLLSLALQRYAVDFLAKREFTPISPPLFMKKEVMAECAQLSQFHEELYRVTGEGMTEADDKYLIATSEQPLCALHRAENIEPKSLPLRYCGISTCFRKEAGAHGKDVRGIFRVHQFDKIEQFVLTSPDTSWGMHAEILKNAEDFLQSLQLPYQVVCIVSGELNAAAAKKLDIECFFPAPEHQHYRELVSCSNCTDYQARRLEVRFGHGKGGKDEAKKYVHMLNSTLCAVTRVISCILENHQTKEGVVVPEPLRPYMNGLELIPFKKPPPPKADEPSAKGKGGKGGKDAKKPSDAASAK